MPVGLGNERLHCAPKGGFAGLAGDRRGHRRIFALTHKPTNRAETDEVEQCDSYKNFPALSGDPSEQPVGNNERASCAEDAEEREEMFPKVRKTSLDLVTLGEALRIRKEELKAVPEALREDALAAAAA